MSNAKLRRYVEDLDVARKYLVTEFAEDYREGELKRRDLLERVYRLTGSVAASASALLALGVKPIYADPMASSAGAPPRQSPGGSPLYVAPDDPAVVAGPVAFRGADGADVQAYWARPAAGRYPVVMIAHENRGTGPHYEDVARRYAKAGYVGLVIDQLSRQGGTAAVPPNEIGGLISTPAAVAQYVGDFRSAMAFLRQQPFVDPNRIGMTGFCFGGGITYSLVAAEPSLRAAVPYYGPVMDASGLRNARAAVFGVYGANDNFVNPSIPNVEAALAAAGVPFRTMQYAGAGHAFYNDTNPMAYNEAAALAAWRDTLAWFATYLRGGGFPATGDGTLPVEEEEAAATAD
jgi:carboxymethylenebutenolidase